MTNCLSKRKYSPHHRTTNDGVQNQMIALNCNFSVKRHILLELLIHLKSGKQVEFMYIKIAHISTHIAEYIVRKFHCADDKGSLKSLLYDNYHIKKVKLIVGGIGTRWDGICY